MNSVVMMFWWADQCPRVQCVVACEVFCCIPQPLCQSFVAIFTLLILRTRSFSPVCDDHDFSDEKLFYRFRRDDGTYEEPVDSAIVAKGQRLYGRSVCRGRGG